MNNKIKIGVSMRVTSAQGYNELRDSISHDWLKFLTDNLHGVEWVLLPNIDTSIIEYVENFGVNAFILTGGEDIGQSPKRDTTELEILKYALNNNFPVLGVCRGMQLIFKYFGGEISQGNEEYVKHHVANQHEILFQNKTYKVNSYHKNKLEIASVPQNINVIGVSTIDKSIEAFEANNILGVMWHPERINESHDWNIKLIKTFFKLNI